ncbi:MAG: hypothetical protein CL528_00470 [Aequorivita sp.]|jgi:hypothetical protein|nr:hypothetical protein [Aequorivita sp.]MBP40224.1 hypothetical protein [Aequorivita sp.]|tara:strand:+ start:787 stop:1284 length:498 start_codon:yes stop_codon:yes gene_type:complete
MNCTDLEYLTMKFFDARRNIIVPGVHWGIARWTNNGPGALHECDVLVLSKAGYATEVEIKISKADLIKDKDKIHGHENDLIKHLFFCVPEKLEEAALHHIPERAGLLVAVKEERVRGTWIGLKIVRAAATNPKALKWTEKERMQLMRLGCLRIVGLKRKLAKNIS